MDEDLAPLIRLIAPSVADRVINLVLRPISENRVKREDMSVLMMALIMEQNHKVLESIERMGNHMTELSKGMNDLLKGVRTANEALSVLLKRTE